MSKRKICMVGEFAVGKTSLTQNFVNNVFSDKYLTTIGVKIDTVTVDETKLIVWDVAGRDSLSPINASYLVGAAGVVLVGDGTRPNTIESLSEIWQVVTDRIGNVPAVLAINKADDSHWQACEDLTVKYENLGWDLFHTSAKDGRSVSELYKRLVQKMS